MTTSPRRPRTSRPKTVVPARPAVGRGRVVTVAVSLTCVAALLGWRLVDLQLTPDATLAGEVGSQVRGYELAAPRGEIVDRFGRSIALSLPRPSVIVDPRLVPADRIPAMVAELSPHLRTDPDVLAARLGRDGAFAYLERQVEPAVAEAVDALDLPGVSLVEEPYREHPNGECTALGIAGRVDIDQKGISGLEEAYDDHLTGSVGFKIEQTQIGGEVRIPGGSQIVDPVEPGHDLRLTIDRNIQFASERRLVEALEETGGGQATAIVTIPATGEVLAMANAVRNAETGEVHCTTTNHAVTWAYEPGSIMKPLTFSAVFEHGAWGVSRSVHIAQKLVYARETGIDNWVFEDINLAGDETHTPQWIMEKSSNNGTITMAEALGPDGLYETFRAFGLGEPTALDFKGEASGILDELDSHILEVPNAAIGQGVAVTPGQMIQAYNTLATGGLRVPLTLVADEVGTSEPIQVLSADTALTVLRLMRGVVSDGTGQAAQLPGYVVAGKTGTAWQPCSLEFGYECVGGGRHYTASFGGIVENDLGAALSVLVVIDDPKGAEYGGGSVAAPVFADVAAYAVGQLAVAPASEGAPALDRRRANPATPVVVADDENDSENGDDPDEVDG